MENFKQANSVTADLLDTFEKVTKSAWKDSSRMGLTEFIMPWIT
jgi:hypothetical protein